MKRSLTESLAYDCVRLIFKSRINDLTEAALNEGVTEGVMLLEKFDEKDAANLEKGVKQIGDMIGGLESKLKDAGEGWKPVIDVLKKSVGELNTKQISQMALSGETKKLAKASAEYTKKIQTIASEIAAILDATEQMRKNLKNFESDVGDNKGETIGALSDKVEAFPDVSKLDKGIASVYKVPKWFQSAWAEGSKSAEKETQGGFFKKAMSFIGGLFKGAKSGRLIKPETLAAAIKATPYEALMDLDLKNEVQALTNSSEDAAGETAELAASGAAASEEGSGGSKEDAPSEKELGAPPASKEDSEKEQATAEKELKTAAEEAVADPAPPGVAANKALDGWTDGLSPDAQDTLRADGRLDSLKTSINTSLEGAADALAKEVQGAIAKWRADNEELLMKSRRFAKQNFDS